MSATTVTATDKSSWPALRALPSELPAPAATHPAKFAVATRFSAGSFATGAHARSGRMSTGELDGPGRESLLAGSNAGAALAAAVASAGALHANPKQLAGGPAPAQTMIGLYHARSGAFQLAPLWQSPGTNDVASYYPVALHAADTPDARFRFTDAKLAAVVGTDGWIVNPDQASAFGDLLHA